jgi:hypothetical protein
MCRTFLLTPGFSPVMAGDKRGNRFNGFSAGAKPLKRLVPRRACPTRLKPGVNETAMVATRFRAGQ